MTLAPTIHAFPLAEAGLFDVDGSILVVFILFIALVPTLNALVVKPIVRVLDERARRTDEAHGDLATITAKVEHDLATYEQGIRTARAAGYKVLEGRRATALAERQAAIEAARGSAEEQIAAGRAEIAGSADAARARLDADSREIARQITSTVLGRVTGGTR